MHRFKDYITRKPWVAVDTETWGNIKKTSVYHPSIQLSHCSWWHEDGEGDVLDWKLPSHKERIQATLAKLCGTSHTTIFWNAAFDIPVIEKLGIKVRQPYFDAMLLAQTIHPELPSYGLKHCARKWLKDPFLEEDHLKAYLKRNRCQYGDVPLEYMYPYAIKDAQMTFELAYVLTEDVDNLDMWDTWQLECQTLPVSISMMKTGIRVDIDKAEKLAEEATARRNKLKRRITQKLGPLNLNSPIQLRKVLYDENNIPSRFTKTGQPSTDNVALLLDGRPVFQGIQRYRAYNRAITNYYKAISERAIQDILHCSLNQGTAITGRYSSSAPNLQNQPRASSSPLGRVRDCFRARSDEHVLVFIDYAQIEMRLTASLAEEQGMVDSILNGEDLHTKTCDLVFGIPHDSEEFKDYRYLAKKLNFSTVYGVGAQKFGISILEDTGGKIRLTMNEALTYISRWWAAHPAVRDYKDRLLAEAAKDGGIRTEFGRRIPVHSSKDHAILNFKIQGTAADIMKRAIVQTNRILKERSAQAKLILTVHDELIFDMPRGEVKELVPLLVEAMEDDSSFQVPLTCDVEFGDTWGTKRPLKLKSLRRS